MNQLCGWTALALVLGLAAAPAQAASETSTGELCWSDAIDADADRMVSREEAQGEAEYAFGRMDKNADSALTWEEYAECLLGSLSAMEKARQATGTAAVARDQTMFEQMDADKSTGVSRDEYMQFGQKAWQGGAGTQNSMAADAYGKAMGVHAYDAAAADRDRDGTISEVEAANDVGFAFTIYDADRDGSLTAEEWTGGVPQQDEVATKRGFSVLDANQDGQVSKDEFSAAGSKPYETAGAEDQPVSVWVFRRFYFQ